MAYFYQGVFFTYKKGTIRLLFIQINSLFFKKINTYSFLSPARSLFHFWHFWKRNYLMIKECATSIYMCFYHVPRVTMLRVFSKKILNNGFIFSYWLVHLFFFISCVYENRNTKRSKPLIINDWYICFHIIVLIKDEGDSVSVH